jgi:glycosyltransferase involved in cell wall biosynthesis
MSNRCLFVIRDLPRPVVSAASVLLGEEALSGTHASGLLVAEGLARHGNEIGICIVHGQTVVDSAVRCFPTLEAAAGWIGNGRAIWLSYGDDSVMDQLSAAGLRPLLWTEIPVSSSNREWLESGRIQGIIAVSDTCRVPMLRSNRHSRVGRIYNPLAPLFSNSAAQPADRFERRVVVYAGAAGTSKGLHRLLEMWKFAHRASATAKLVLAGTGRLYGNERELGPFGIASPEFESRYVAPLAEEFGSLSGAGIEVAGLLTPRELRDVYVGASLGVVNMNWNEYTETFCCAAVEMVATGLPVFSVARAALPETIGLSGGAVLTEKERPEQAAREFNALLANPTLLSKLGLAGQNYVRREYGVERIVDAWERLLQHGADIESLSGSWRGPQTPQYFLELIAGRLRAPWLIDVPVGGLHMLKRALG